MLRVALLAMMEPAAPAQAMPRAFLTVAGVPVARHQLGVVLALECQRIICIARELTPELIALQHDAERAGAQFHVIPGPRALAGLVTANDEVIALVDGLLATSQDAVSLIEANPGVLVQPIEAGLAAGFERIDLNYASAGAMRIPGRLIERLNELPPDCDATSALTRIALQAGIPTREIPAAMLEGGRWALVRDEAMAHASEGEWIRRQVGDRRLQSPGHSLARFAVLNFGPALLHAGSGSTIVALAVVATLLMALGSGWLDFTVAGLILLAGGWVAVRLVGLLDRVEEQSRVVPPRAFTRERVLGWSLDAVLVTVLSFGALHPGRIWYDAVFVPLMLVGLLRLLQRVLDRRWAAWMEDRMTIVLVLSIAAAADVLAAAVEILALLLLLGGLLLTAKPRLTGA